MLRRACGLVEWYYGLRSGGLVYATHIMLASMFFQLLVCTASTVNCRWVEVTWESQLGRSQRTHLSVSYSAYTFRFVWSRMTHLLTKQPISRRFARNWDMVDGKGWEFSAWVSPSAMMRLRIASNVTSSNFLAVTMGNQLEPYHIIGYIVEQILTWCMGTMDRLTLQISLFLSSWLLPRARNLSPF